MSNGDVPRCPTCGVYLYPSDTGHSHACGNAGASYPLADFRDAEIERLRRELAVHKADAMSAKDEKVLPKRSTYTCGEIAEALNEIEEIKEPKDYQLFFATADRLYIALSPPYWSEDEEAVVIDIAEYKLP